MSSGEEGEADVALKSLGVTLMEQDSLEREMAEKVDQAMITKDDELDNKRLQKSLLNLEKANKRLSLAESKLNNPATRISERESLRKDISWLKDNDIAALQKDIQEIKDRLNERTKAKNDANNTNDDSSVKQLPSETRQDFLIRTGKITAFGSSNGFEQNAADSMDLQAQNHQQLRAPGIDKIEFDESDSALTDLGFDDADFKEEEDDEDGFDLSEGDPLEDDNDDTPLRKKRRSKASKKDDSPEEVLRNIDDGNEAFYQRRLATWAKKRSGLRAKYHPEYQDDASIPEWLKPHPKNPDAILNSDFKVPGDIYPSLFDYQKTCVQWLWELYSQKTGGIIGDEMGLGKTIQIIAFLAGLHYSGKLDKPVLIVCPATVLRQWSNEFHTWWPPLRTIILHSIGTGMAKGKKEEDEEKEFEDILETEEFDEEGLSASSIKSQGQAKRIVEKVFKSGHVLITTYVGLRIYAKHLLNKKWGYVVLDEGHKIRNPNSAISLTCKQLKTPNRIILSGTPIQNNLIELWSLFDFIFPGRLGTLPVFQQQFSIPINIGGYANATNVQVQTGYKCAVVLRDLISPYLLRRVKADVAKDLPKKNEMVLFCKLTKHQLTLYEKFLRSADMESVLTGKRHVLYGVDYLRKICNHPDLVAPISKANASYGDYRKSGKMQVVKPLIELWKSEGHKTLLFTQTRQMLDILEKFLSTINEKREGNPFKYLRMDGTTPIANRQALVDEFNDDPTYDLFLLTTRVGGLGVNLTGANRVIIYDPDWNPSTDVQARERAWRLGQKKDVTIYRLMIASSIEEKIYHRQIFKQFLTNKILKDPKQRRFFKMNDLHDLFTLGDPNERGTETGDMFDGTETNFEGLGTRKSKQLNKSLSKDDDDFEQVININGVTALKEYQGDKKDQEKSQDSERIMENIFASSGVHSALQHDSIMESSRPDTVLIDREASKIADEAARKLRESRKAVRRSKIGTPTFTGRFGAAGRIQKLGGSQKNPSSRSILESLKAKKDLEAQKNGDKKTVVKENASPLLTNRSASPFNARSRTPEAVNVSEMKETELIAKIRDFISNNGGKATSSEVVLHINLKAPSPSEVQLIRSMLRSICDWQSDTKLWSLKEEFAD